MNTLAYKGYFARVKLDADDQIFVGHLAGINDAVGFHADNVGDLIRAFRDAVNDYVATCQAAGKPAEKPYSGNLMLRVKPDIHAQAALAAQVAGKSMNQRGEEALSKAAQPAVSG